MRSNVVACRGCDLLQRLPALLPGGKARCGRCNQLVATHPVHGLDTPLALAIAAAILVVVANVSPLMSLSAAGRTASTTLAGGAIEMWLRGDEITALVVAFCAVVAPALYVGALLVVLLSVQRSRAPSWVAGFAAWAERLRPWSMNDVLLLGILVSLTKIAELADVVPGPGLFAVGGLVFLLPWLASTLDPAAVWSRIRWVSERDTARGAPGP
jgi:paraquat-inducible protein A